MADLENSSFILNQDVISAVCRALGSPAIDHAGAMVQIQTTEHALVVQASEFIPPRIITLTQYDGAENRTPSVKLPYRAYPDFPPITPELIVLDELCGSSRITTFLFPNGEVRRFDGGSPVEIVVRNQHPSEIEDREIPLTLQQTISEGRRILCMAKLVMPLVREYIPQMPLRACS